MKTLLLVVVCLLSLTFSQALAANKYRSAYAKDLDRKYELSMVDYSHSTEASDHIRGDDLINFFGTLSLNLPIRFSSTDKAENIIKIQLEPRFVAIAGEGMAGFVTLGIGLEKRYHEARYLLLFGLGTGHELAYDLSNNAIGVVKLFAATDMAIDKDFGLIAEGNLMMINSKIRPSINITVSKVNWFGLGILAQSAIVNNDYWLGPYISKNFNIHNALGEDDHPMRDTHEMRLGYNVNSQSFMIAVKMNIF